MEALIKFYQVELPIAQGWPFGIVACYRDASGSHVSEWHLSFPGESRLLYGGKFSSCSPKNIETGINEIIHSNGFCLRAGCSRIVAQVIMCLREGDHCKAEMNTKWPSLAELDVSEFAGLIIGAERSGDLFKIWKKSGCKQLCVLLSCIMDASVYHEQLYEPDY